MMPNETRGNALFHHHDGDDWCHICGDRAESRCLEDIWFPVNAEHGPAIKGAPGPRSIRICAVCFEFGVERTKLAKGNDK